MTSKREQQLEQCIRDLRGALEYYATEDEGWDLVEHANVYEDSRELVPDEAMLAWRARQAERRKA